MQPELIINENGDLVYLIRNWLPIDYATNLFNQLIQEIPWEQHYVLFGKPERRLTYAIGDPGLVHRYSNSSRPVANWTQITNFSAAQLKEITRQASQLTAVPLNAVLLNFYRDGTDYISPHSDKETSPLHSTVVTISLGRTRLFVFRNKQDRRKIEFPVRHGDLLVMAGNTQQHWTHGVPEERLPETIQRQHEPSGRISITIRHLQ